MQESLAAQKQRNRDSQQLNSGCESRPFHWIQYLTFCAKNAVAGASKRFDASFLRQASEFTSGKPAAGWRALGTNMAERWRDE